MLFLQNVSFQHRNAESDPDVSGYNFFGNAGSEGFMIHLYPGKNSKKLH
jgi:hypothetical protein